MLRQGAACEKLADTAANPDQRAIMLFAARRWRELAAEEQNRQILRANREQRLSQSPR